MKRILGFLLIVIFSIVQNLSCIVVYARQNDNSIDTNKISCVKMLKDQYIIGYIDKVEFHESDSTVDIMDIEEFTNISNDAILSGNMVYDINNKKQLNEDNELLKRYKQCRLDLNLQDNEEIFFTKEKIIVFSQVNNIFSMKYYEYYDNKVGDIINEDEIKATSIDFDKDGILYYTYENKLYKYENNKSEEVLEVNDDYKVNIYDQDNVLLYSDSSVMTTSIPINNCSIEDEKDINILGNSYDEFSISYDSYLSNIGWQGNVQEGEVSGTIGNEHIEAFRIDGNNIKENINIKYQSYIQYSGWQDMKSIGEESGTEGKKLAIEAVRISIETDKNFNITYRVYVQGMGWQDWKANGDIAGTTGINKPISAIQIKLIKNSLSYKAHVSNIGWQEEQKDGKVVGTVGESKAIEAFKINSDNIDVGSIQYKSFVKGSGWQSLKNSGEVSGTVGQNKPIQAISIGFKSNKNNNYHIEYRVHISNVGWQSWVRDGEVSGTVGKNAIEAIQIRIVEGMVQYKSHIQNDGWEEFKSENTVSGTVGESKRLEGIIIQNINLPEGTNITYRTHVQNIGWQSWVRDKEFSGTEGMSLALEGIEIKLINPPEGYHVEYRTQVQDIGWQSWVRDGELAGTTGLSKRLEAIQIKIVQEDYINGLYYSSHISNEGWKSNSFQNEESGSDGNNYLEAFKCNLNSSGNIGLTYRTHISNIGWQGWVNNGEVSGTTGEGKAVEGIQIKLTNSNSRYSICYRVYIKNYGWQNWKRDGQLAGSTGLSNRITKIQVKIIKNISQPNIEYRTHVSNYGWQSFQNNGQIAGKTNKNIEAINISMNNLSCNTSIQYRTHVSYEGWQNWVGDGQLSGTTGQGKSVQAIQMRLSCPIDGYSLYYRVFVEGYGWQEWKTDNQIAGTVNQSRAIQQIQVKLVKNKNKLIVIDPGHNYGGDEGAYSTFNGIVFCERDLNMQISNKLKRALEAQGYDVILTRTSNDIDKVDVMKSLNKRVNIANVYDADFFISIHHNAAVSSGAFGVETYYSDAMPNIGSRYDNKISLSKRVATDMVNTISSSMGRKNGGARNSKLYVAKNTRMASILLECGYITNSSEAYNLASEKLQLDMAENIAEVINRNVN